MHHMICQRFSVKTPGIPEGPLAEDRTKDARVYFKSYDMI